MGAAAAAAVPAGRGQHAPLPRSVAAELKPRRRTCTSEAIHSNPNRAGSTQIASKMRFRSLPKIHVRSHPQQPKPSGKHANSVKNAFPKPSKNALPKPSTATQTEREAHKYRQKCVSEAFQKCTSEASQNQQKLAWNTKLCVKNAFPKLPKINKKWPGARSGASKMRFRSLPKSTKTGLEHEAVRQK